MVKDWKQIVPTNNPIVDAVATIIFARRKQGMALKSISLSVRCYAKYSDWVKKNLEDSGDFFIEGQKYQFDGVDIDLSHLQTKDIVETYYPMKPVTHD